MEGVKARMLKGIGWFCSFLFAPVIELVDGYSLAQEREKHTKLAL